MKKEISLVTAAGFFLLAYILDFIAGPTSFTVKNPIVFLSHEWLGRFPLTAVAIGVRTIALFLTIVLSLSFIKRKYFIKAFLSFATGGIGILYAIQQLATGNRVTTIQWTLTIAYTSFVLFALVAFYILKGILISLKEGLSSHKGVKESSDHKDNQEEED